MPIPLHLALALLLALASLPATAASRLELRDGRPVCLPQGEIPDVFPGAAWSSVTVDGAAVLEARRDGELEGHLFLTHRLDGMVAYSGKPLEILVALAAEGTIVRTRLIAHHEPILLVGIPEKVLHDFIAQFEGRGIENLLRSRVAGESEISLDAVSGATVTALVADQVILGAAKTVARSTGVLGADTGGAARFSQDFAPMGWRQLLDAGLLQHVRLPAADVEGEGAAGGEDWLDLYYGVLNPPALGANLLGEEAYRGLMADHPGKTLLVLLNDGSYSFRGSGFVRGGIFDRLQLTQGMEITRFRDSDYHYQFAVRLQDAPRLREKAVFIVPDPSFNGALPWELEVLVTRRSHETAKSKRFIHFNAAYDPPAGHVVAPASQATGADAMIARIWSGKKAWIALYALLWAVVVLAFAFRRRMADNRKVLEYFHLAVLACSILLLGVGQKGQPSVVNIFTFVDVTRSGSGPGLFLTEPFIFVSWIMITVTALLWGRGPFCGWICPYGGLLEIAHFLRNRVLPRRLHARWELPDAWHERLKLVPYFTFGLLLTVSLFSLSLAEQLAELEPFKTTWLVGVTNRPWYLAAYWVWLLGMGLITVRFFCRYLCPLGGYLAILARFQIFKLPRRNFCSTCKICTKGCSTRAIDAQGRIDSKTCFGCLECLNQMHDPKVCPPLLKPEIWEKHEAPRAASR